MNKAAAIATGAALIAIGLVGLWFWSAYLHMLPMPTSDGIVYGSGLERIEGFDFGEWSMQTDGRGNAVQRRDGRLTCLFHTYEFVQERRGSSADPVVPADSLKSAANERNIALATGIGSLAYCAVACATALLAGRLLRRRRPAGEEAPGTP
jgi:hypothetical protein